MYAVTTRVRARPDHNSAYLLFDCSFNGAIKFELIAAARLKRHLCAGCMAPVPSMTTMLCYGTVFSMARRFFRA
jgi:hypothetical protein